MAKGPTLTEQVAALTALVSASMGAEVAPAEKVAEVTAEAAIDLGPELLVQKRVPNIKDGGYSDNPSEGFKLTVSAGQQLVVAPTFADRMTKPSKINPETGKPRNQNGVLGAKVLDAAVVAAIRNGDADKLIALTA